MVFPATPLDATYELWIDDAWTDITSLVYGRDPVTITRGRSSEGAQTDRSTCRATVNNRSGDLSPRNPVGAYYGLIGRNTPLRVRVTPATDAYVLITNSLEDISTPDSAGLSITGDLDVRLDLEREDWGNIIGLCGKWGAAGQRSWQLVINADHTLSLLWSADGTTELTATSTAAATISDGDRIALRATIDVDNGAAGRTVTFYTASTIDGSWSQLGSPVTTGGVTSIFDSTADVQIGELDNGAYFGPIGRIYGFELYSGIAGTLRADLDFTDRPPTGTPLVDSAGNTWTPDDGTSFIDPGCRFLGEISDWPQRWDVSGTDIHVPLEASGIMRRLSQGSTLLHSTMYRGITALANQPKAYWPCEDGADATVIASAVPGGSPMTLKSVIVDARPGFGQHTDFKCSAPLPTMGESQWTGLVSSYSPTGIVRVWFLLHVPTAGAIDGESIIHVVLSGGTTARWRITYGTGGTLALRAFDADQNEIFTTGALGFNVNGLLCRIALELEQDGADVDYSLTLLEVGESVGIGSSGTVTSETIGRCSAIVINPGADLDDVAVGHIQVHDDNSSIFDLFEELNAYSGEAAGRRIERLCEEEGVSFRAVGDLDDTTAMGYQLPHALFELLREAEDTDGGILFEPREMLGLAYRTRESMYDQDPALTLDYSANDLSGIEPIDDDQHVRNDITVTRTGGSSVRAVQEDGPLSIEAPPAGVGRYDEGVTVSLETDLQLADHAGWRLHLGTVDEARYPTLQVDLTRSNFIGANLAQTSAVQDLDLGDRLTVENPPAWLPPDDITQLAEGFVEVLANFTHTVDINCSPESPWSQAATYDAADVHYSSDGTTLAEALDTTETAVDISTPSGPVWDDADAPYDWLVGGEVMTVTAISGTGASQTATVTRSVNGVVKTHASGATVELAHPSVYVE